MNLFDQLLAELLPVFVSFLASLILQFLGIDGSGLGGL
jgi:hypothetical protein